MSLPCLFDNTCKTSQSIVLLIAIYSYHHGNKNRFIKTIKTDLLRRYLHELEFGSNVLTEFTTALNSKL